MESTRRGRSSVRARAALALTVALCATSLVGEASTGVTGAITTPAAQQLGFYPGYANLIQFKALETWVGRDANYVLQFADQTATKFPGSVWGQVTKAGALQTIANRVTLVESIPLAFGNNIDASTAAGQAYARTALQATANGANDANYRIAAKYIRDGGYADSIIRLGWEFDGGWYPWSARGNEALWVTAYRHVVGVFRTISPTFRFDWNGDPGAIQKETAAYPGDAYVDIIGLDVYDKGIPVPWSSATKSWVDPVAALNWDLTSLRFQRDFATAHGKQVSYPEWALSGVTTTVTSGVGGDNPTFVQGMNDFMNALPSSGPGSLAYQAYFNEDAGDGNHRINATYFPTAQQRYRSAFGSTTDFIVSSNNSAPVFG
ncbi:MAG TPA: glycosyl hydrolase, partial [Acidimicrobiia bacterium]|nr:glycosyl hydrolase [Acidimicrobiia bacterium]